MSCGKKTNVKPLFGNDPLFPPLLETPSETGSKQPMADKIGESKKVQEQQVTK